MAFNRKGRKKRLFPRLFLWFILRPVKARPGRTFAVLLGIALGASVFTSVRLAADASLRSFSRSMDLVAGNADRVVARPGGRVPEDLTAELAAHPAVQAASPVLSTYVKGVGESAEVFLLLGFDPLLDRSLRQWRTDEELSETGPLWLDLIRRPCTLFMTRSLARSYGLSPGDEVELEHVRQRARFRLLGTLEPRGLALVEGGMVALADIATFQEFTGLHGKVDRIDLLLKPGATPGDSRELEELLPRGVVLEDPGAEGESGRGMIRAYRLNLSVLSFVSLFVGMFLVYSLVALNAASRRRELAILRSVGGSPHLLFALFLGEGLFYGLAGWLLAVPASALLVRYLLAGVSRTVSTLFARVRVEELPLDSWEVALSFAATVGISALAAFQPAREAMKTMPREALSADGAPSTWRTSSGGEEGPSGGPSPSWRFPGGAAGAGLALLACVWPVSRLPGMAGLPWPGYLATFLLFSGFALLAPRGLRVMGRVLPSPLRRLGGEPAYLAARYLTDAGMRTAVSVGALVTAMALFTALVIMVHSFRSTVDLWVHQTISGDLFLRSHMAGVNRYRDTLPQPFVERIRQWNPGLDFVPYRRIYHRYEPHGDDGDGLGGEAAVPYQLDAIDFEAFRKHARFLFVRGDPGTAMERLVRGEAVFVSQVFANRAGVGVGDRFRARLEGAELDFPVAAVVRDYRTQGGVVFVDLGRFAELTGVRAWSGLRIHFPRCEGDVEEAAARLRREIFQCCTGSFNIEITVGEDLRRAVLRIFDETFGVTTVLLLIALAVAALGIATTLTVLVLERRGQLGTLAAVGAEPSQIRSMIVWEAVLMVLAGEALGLLCGFGLSWLLIFVINLQSFGWTFLYGVDWMSLWTAVPLILGAALLASVPACRMALSLPPATVLRGR